mgnify:CR=1 FL=1
MTNNPGKQIARRVRLKEIETAMLAGVRTGDICSDLAPKYDVSRATIRRDIKAVSKAHQGEIFAYTELESRGRYYAACVDLRRQAVDGIPCLDQYGNIRITGRDLKLAHQLDQEIARLRGMDSDGRAVMIAQDKFRAALDQVMTVVFTIVTDPEDRDKLLEGFKRLDQAGTGQIDPNLALIRE